MRKTSGIRIAQLLVITFALFGLGLRVEGIVIGWHEKLAGPHGVNLNLGDGLLLNRQDQPLQPGLVELGTNGTHLNDGWQSEQVTFAEHTADLVKTLSVNSSVSLNNLVGSGDT